MARDYINIGSSPYGESCAQVGSDDYAQKSRIELRAFKHQLERLFPKAEFRIKSFPHDFGSYSEVCVFFDDEDEVSCELAYCVDNNAPEFWDSEALTEMEAARKPIQEEATQAFYAR